jgi:hypothetical protein
MLLTKIRINTSYPFLGRAAGRSIVGTLNFTIVNAAANELRKRTNGVPVLPVDLDPLMAKYGNTLDNRNEQDELSRSAAHDQQLREEQGFATKLDPMELAGRLKVIRDAIAEDLDEHAGLMRNPLDPRGGTFKNPYDVAPMIEDSFQRQLKQQPRVNEVMIRAQADALDIPFEDALRVTKAGQEAGLRFLKDNRDELMVLIQTLSASAPDGSLMSTADAEDVFETLPAIQKARLYVAADRGLWYERDRVIRMLMNGHPDAAGNRKLIDGLRIDIHGEFERIMRQPDFRREIDEAVQRGAKWPVLLDLPKSVQTAVAKAA